MAHATFMDSLQTLLPASVVAWVGNVDVPDHVSRSAFPLLNKLGASRCGAVGACFQARKQLREFPHIFLQATAQATYKKTEL